MTISEINTLLTRYTGANTGTYSAAERLIDVNNAYHKVASMIFDSQDESDFDDINHADYPDLTVPLVANQRDYAIAQSERVVSVKKVSISYNGTDVYTATPLDSGETELPGNAGNATAETTLDSYFSKTAPRYDYRNNAFFIYPRANASDVAAGGYAYFEWSREVDPFTSGQVTTGTREPGLPSAYHILIPQLAALDWCTSKGKTMQVSVLAEMIKDNEARLRREYGKKNRDRRLALQARYEDYS